MAEEGKPAAPTTTDGQHGTGNLMESAKTVAEAAQSAIRRDANIDKAKVAGAAENVLEAAEKYGKLDQKGAVGQYVDKAEGYLHQYHSGQSQDSSTTTATATGEGEEKDEKASGGVGGYVKMAQGFFK